MALFSTIFGDQQLQNIDRQIEDIINSIPVKDIIDNSSERNASEIIHQLLSVEDRFSDKESLKKNPFYKGIKDQQGIMSEVGTLLDKLTIQPDRANRYKTYEEI